MTDTRASTGAPRPTPPVTVIVTVLRDPRVARTLESLLLQDLLPAEILVDDGEPGGEVQRITAGFTERDSRVRHLAAPGTIPESRNAALKEARTDLVAFLDADEVAPPSWLRMLLDPFENPQVGFVGGPTPGIPESLQSIGARYYDGYLRRFYDRVARHRPSSLPMGNSAWRMAVFRQVGWLDTTLFPFAASEDQEIALRALDAGWQGVYLSDAKVLHDFSDLSTAVFLRKQARYAEGGFVVWRRRKATYEASLPRLLPYTVPPAVAILGAILLVLSASRIWGFYLIAAAAATLALIALLLTVQGVHEDSRYPGLRYRALEIPRRWATLLGAFRGWVHYGWKGTGPGPRTPSKKARPSKR